MICPYCLLLAICPVCMALSYLDLSGLPEDEAASQSREPPSAEE